MQKHKGTITAVGENVGIATQGTQKASIELAWTPVTGDTIEFEGQAHPEGSWGSIEGFLMSDIDGTGATSATDSGIWMFNVHGISRIRARASVLVAASVSVKIYAE
ncbi:MAG: hypothetical protein KAJ73_03220 [Zetaproteobacteria bacterium]|nr:hypothetical protein [Zetaproteobacteria bacterium]